MATKFAKAWERSRIQGYSTLNQDKHFITINITTSLLSRAIDKTGVDKKTFAEKRSKKICITLSSYKS